MRRATGTGLLLIASALLSVGGYLILGTQFGWPAVLDEPGTTALDAFVEAQAWVRFGFYLFLLSSLVLIPAAIGLLDRERRPRRPPRRSPPSGCSAPSPRCSAGCAGPSPSRGSPTPGPTRRPPSTEREATAAAYDVLNGYAGAALGEHLGWLLQGIWAVGVAVLAPAPRPAAAVVRRAGPRRWPARGPLAVPAATAVGLATLEFWGLNVYTAWYLWLLALGVLLVLRSRRGRPVSRAGGGADSAARSRVSSTRQ